jgi:tripartite-type tricarboxylate transporter receptor subunit TctC
MNKKSSTSIDFKRHFALLLLSLLSLLSTVPSSAQAQSKPFPDKPIRIIVPFAPGGLTDNVIRVFVAKFSKELNQSVVIENKPGANGNIGTSQVAQSSPDGYTLLAAFDGTIVIFNTLKDFDPIANLGVSALVLAAHPSVSANNVKELVALLKAKPNSLSYASAGTGSTNHLAAEMLQQRAGVQMEHIPYKGGGQAVADVTGGHVPLIYTSVSTVQQFIKQGKLKALGVSSRTRSPALPDVPTFIENGIEDFEVTSWIGLAAPANTPKSVLDKLHNAAVAAVNNPDVKEQYKSLGIESIGNTPEEFRAQIVHDLAMWGAIIKKANIKLIDAQ